MSEAPPEDGGRDVKRMAGPGLQHLKFLVVEDDAHMRAFLVSMLGELGVKAIGEAAEGGAALAFMQSYAPDIVITDLHMEPIDGLELVRRVRAGSGTINRYTPFILLTVHTERQRIDEARAAGVNEFVAKPVAVRPLYARISALIEEPRPFVHTDSYFGPDRRRKQVPIAHPNRRKVMPWLTKVGAPGAGGPPSAAKS